ncbi:MAG: NAD(P)-dependent dehydrogenase (short-subunit alcohol dehydrogenase family) [Actinomycetes bacterium]|jgi:NAD(P)-dependent dehydrogenase (short-subunit alcohol dehydrogenase family)
MADEHRTTPDIENKSVLVTGGAHGIGEGVARALSALGAHVTIADIDADRGHSVAADIDGQFISTDVSEYDANIAAVQAATRRFGTLDIAILNAGVISNVPMGATFDPDQYRRAMGINLDGVVFGINAALPALLAAGGGDIIVTASMAGIAPTPLDPVYAANKTGLVGLVRSFGLRSVHDGIRTNAVCPAFADTRLIAPIRSGLSQAGIPLLSVETVVQTFVDVLNSGESGQCWFVQPGRTSEPFAFPGVPGPKRADGSPASAAETSTQRHILDQN